MSPTNQAICHSAFAHCTKEERHSFCVTHVVNVSAIAHHLVFPASIDLLKKSPISYHIFSKRHFGADNDGSFSSAIATTTSFGIFSGTSYSVCSLAYISSISQLSTYDLLSSLFDSSSSCVLACSFCAFCACCSGLSI